MSKPVSIAYMVTFFTIIFGFAIASLFSPEKDISAIENRALGKLPDFSLEAVTTPRFFEEMNQYFNDQIVLRNEMVKLYQKQQNSRLFNSMLFENIMRDQTQHKPEEGTIVDDSRIVSNLVLINRKWILPVPDKAVHTSEIDAATANLNDAVAFAEAQKTETFFVFNPSRTISLMHLYPPYLQTDAYVRSRDYFLSKLDKNINVVDLRSRFDTFTNAELEDLYLETDHHWNIKGAFLAYQEMIRQISNKSSHFKGEPMSLSDIHVSALSNGRFEGSYNRQIHDAVDPEKADRTMIYEPKVPFTFQHFEVINTDGKQTIRDFSDFYGYKSGQSPVSYGTFFGGDRRKITYENPKAGNQLHVLLLKDSFMNPITPYLAQSFQKLTVYDNRYYPEFSLKNILASEHYDILIIALHDDNLYSQNYSFEK
ncbi:DHHW family protein [Brevibacillus ruminantium]|uniref:DHHW family protein n=1 Tax=Brevibacillus ruminantium TaxID=2950604 RepID=A0ABY4WEQ7_9BACL|nr:DHHW family protein [Brevibacillus ruminantium]USG64613.1 DHHW family protein [Brevibacillus ruminantium]